MAETTEGSAGSNGGSILTRKTGPLANWIWMALILLLALGFSMWQRNRQQTPDANMDTTVEPATTLDNQTPPPIFILPQNPQPSVPINITVPTPTGPTPVTPTTPTPVTPTPSNPTPTPTTPIGAPPVAVKPPPTAPAPKPAPPPKATIPVYATVTVAKYTSKNPPWNSTLWGIAKHYGKGGASNNYTSIWDDPKNAALKKKRGKPTSIQPGDKIYVRVK